MCTIISESVHLCFSTYTVFLRVPELLGFLVRRCILKLTGESFVVRHSYRSDFGRDDLNSQRQIIMSEFIFLFLL